MKIRFFTLVLLIPLLSYGCAKIELSESIEKKEESTSKEAPKMETIESKESAKTATVSRLEHISNTYLAAHAYTPEYAFQEKVRRMDLSIKKELETLYGKTKSNAFFVNGWGQIISAVVALRGQSLSSEFNTVINDNINKAIIKAKSDSNPFINVNVREYTKNILMYPHQGRYLPWKRTSITAPLEILNKALDNYSLNFSIFEGKCYLMVNGSDGKSIFSELWKSGFESHLEEHGFIGMKPNNETVHVTLINSNVIAAIKDKFKEKYRESANEKFVAFYDIWFEKFNKILHEERKHIKFIEFTAAYSEDYTPFEDVLAVQLKAPYIKTALTEFANAIREEVGYSMPPKEDDMFHISIAIKYREPEILLERDLLKLIGSSDKFSLALSEFYTKFIA